MSGIRHRFAVLSNQPRNIAPFDTFNVVFCVSYMLTSSLSNTVIYPASANFAVLRRAWVLMDSTMWTSFAGCPTLCASSLTVAAAVLVPSGNWKILVEMRPVGIRGAVGVPTLDVAALSATMEGMEDSLFDELFEGGDVVDVVDAFLLFDLAGWRGCVV